MGKEETKLGNPPTEKTANSGRCAAFTVIFEGFIYCFIFGYFNLLVKNSSVVFLSYGRANSFFQVRHQHSLQGIRARAQTRIMRRSDISHRGALVSVCAFVMQAAGVSGF